MIRIKLVLAAMSVGVLSACADGSGDKVRHFGAGTVAAYAGEKLTGSKAWGCAAALAVGTLKEHVDQLRGGNFDSDDLLATVAGCSVTFVF